MCDGHCASEDECKETDSGAGYSGDLARSASGRPCYTWSDLDSYVRDHLWKSHDVAVMPSLRLKNASAPVCLRSGDHSFGVGRSRRQNVCLGLSISVSAVFFSLNIAGRK